MDSKNYGHTPVEDITDPRDKTYWYWFVEPQPPNVVGLDWFKIMTDNNAWGRQRSTLILINNSKIAFPEDGSRNPEHPHIINPFQVEY